MSFSTLDAQLGYPAHLPGPRTITTVPASTTFNSFILPSVPDPLLRRSVFRLRGSRKVVVGILALVSGATEKSTRRRLVVVEVGANGLEVDHDGRKEKESRCWSLFTRSSSDLYHDHRPSRILQQSTPYILER